MSPRVNKVQVKKTFAEAKGTGYFLTSPCKPWPVSTEGQGTGWLTFAEAKGTGRLTFAEAKGTFCCCCRKPSGRKMKD